MSHLDITTGDEVWSQLQQPVSLSGNEPRLRLLLSALDQGWRIEDPVYLRPRWGEQSARVFNFILHRARHAPRLITVPESPEADRFIRNENLRVLTQST
ncbi:MAG: hypothetical protein ACT4QE_03425 [Anaerolineales bacterium]